LSVGDFHPKKDASYNENLLAYSRLLNKDEIFVVINPNSSIHSIEVENSWDVLYQLNMEVFNVEANSTIKLPAYSALVLSKVLE
jgi:hypothetical protein